MGKEDFVIYLIRFYFKDSQCFTAYEQRVKDDTTMHIAVMYAVFH